MLGLTVGCVASPAADQDDPTILLTPTIWSQEATDGNSNNQRDVGRSELLSGILLVVVPDKPLGETTLPTGDDSAAAGAAAAGAISAEPGERTAADSGTDAYVPANAGGQLTHDELRDTLRLAGWPEHLWDEAAAVVECESKRSPAAIGDSGRSVGLFQIGIARPGWQGWFLYFGIDEAGATDAHINAYVGWLTWQYGVERYGYGWGPWACRP